MENTASFGQWLNSQRKAQDISQIELAERLGYSEGAIRKLEGGHRRPSREMAQLLADYFQVPQQLQPHFILFARGISTVWSFPQENGEDTNAHLFTLPAETTSFLGRSRELAMLSSFLLDEDKRLVSLVGPGGVGKTRLALRVTRSISTFRDGVIFVDLGSIAHPNMVPQEIAQVLNIRDCGNQPITTVLCSYLSNKHMLLVLDTFEHVSAAAPVISKLLTTAPKLKVLVTSRVALRLRGEHEFQVPPLAIPALRDATSMPQARATPGQGKTEAVSDSSGDVMDLIDCESVHLFVERAKAISPDFCLSDESAFVVAQLCRQLDGLPLAIELAAAHVRTLSPAGILARLNTGMDLLTEGPLDAPARQQTLRNTIEWSYNLLDSTERDLFNRLSVFQGGCTLDAAKAVCSAEAATDRGTLETLSLLIRQNLLRSQEKQARYVSAETRYAMLDTVREYAWERLQASGEAHEMRERHARYFLRLAEEASSRVIGATQLASLEQIAIEQDNIRAALDWAQVAPGPSGAELFLRFVYAMAHFWELHGGFEEGARRAAIAIARPDAQGPTEARAWALYTAARLGGNLPANRAFYDECLSIARALNHKLLVTRGLVGLGHVARVQGDYGQARSHYLEALAIRRELGDKVEIGQAIASLGDLAELEGNYELASASWRESYELAAEAQDTWTSSAALLRLAIMSHWNKDFDSAAIYADQSIALSQQLGDNEVLSEALYIKGSVALVQEKYSDAKALLCESMAVGYRMGEIVTSLLGLASLAFAQGQPMRAAVLLAAMAAELAPADVVLGKRLIDDIQHIQTTVQAQLSEAAWNTAWSEGRAMTTAQIVAYVLRDV